MNFKLFKKKLKSEKGVTGIDIVVASTIILVSMGVIISIYTNINNANKSVTRKSGATRVATQIVEKIDMFYYDQLVNELKNFTSSLDPDYCYFLRDASTPALPENGTYIIKTISDTNVGSAQSFLGVKIPRGYTLNCVVKNSFGTNEVEGYDLVKTISVKVQFDVAGVTKEVALTTVKGREKVEKRNNLPKTDLSSRDITGLVEVTFLKKTTSLISGTTFTKVTPTDSSWYEYGEEGIRAAYMVVTTDTFTPEFNAEGELDISSNRARQNMYIWIPACEVVGPSPNYKVKYGYLNTDREVKTINVVRSNDSSDKLGLLTVDESSTINNILGDHVAGRWVPYNSYGTSYNILTNVIN